MLSNYCIRGYSFVYIMSLRQWERHIEPQFLHENQPLQKGLLDTVKAVYHIHLGKLFQREYQSVDNYLLRRWNGCCKRNTFYRLSNAGKVIHRLEEAGCGEDDLPRNMRLCLAILYVSKDYSLSLETIWTILLARFWNCDNVSCAQITKYFKGQLGEPNDSAGEGTTAFPISLTTPTPPPTVASARKQLTIQTANLNNDRNEPQLLQLLPRILRGVNGSLLHHPVTAAVPARMKT